jgi:hypothetical protein
VVVTDTSNTNNKLNETVTVSDDTYGGFTFGSLHTTSTTLSDNGHVVSNALTETAVVGGFVTDTATATGTVQDSFGNTAHPVDTDSATYLSLGLPGLTKGFWANHLNVWDVVTTDDTYAQQLVTSNPQVISSSADLNQFYGTAAHSDGIDWNKDGHVDNSTLSSSGQVSGANNGGGDYGLLLGDIGHTGVPQAGDIFFDLTSAQLLLNSSVSGDARVILTGQALAAQLNDYNAGGHEPNGLIEAAAQWLAGAGPLSNGHSNIDTNVNNDVTVPGPGTIKTVISDTAGADYTVTGGAITLGGTALSSSDASWSLLTPNLTNHLPGSNGYMPTVLTGYTDINNKTINVVADGQGLSNALQAYNQGQLVISSDGSQIGWSSGGVVSDVHSNTAGEFWGILEDQNIQHAGTIVGVAVATGTIV